MTVNKDFKRLVRARMRKTGEGYTTARAQLLKRSSPLSAIGSPRAESRKPKADFAALAGMSDAAIKKSTGCTWQKWVKALDYYGAHTMAHAEIVKLVKDKYDTPDWWTQNVVVGYERIKGLRQRGQRRDGTFEASKSRTFSVPVSTLFDAWANTRTRREWLNGTDVTVRTSTAPKSMRLGMSDGTIVAVGFYPKGKGKSSVAVQQDKLPDRETAQRLKEFWTERLEKLGEVLR